MSIVQATCLRGQPLDAGDAAAVLDVVHHRLAVQVVDGRLAVHPTAQNQRIDVRPEISQRLSKNSKFCIF